MTRPTNELARQEPHRGGALQLFYEQFEPYLSTDDCMQFFSNRNKAGRQTYLSSDIYTADKLSTVILEEYAVRGKMGGHVIVVLPDPDTNVPIFSFQLGGDTEHACDRRPNDSHHRYFSQGLHQSHADNRRHFDGGRRHPT